MSYANMLGQLFQINQDRGVKLGLDHVLQLQKSLGFPDQKFVSIHVAGTNGKGSVSTKIAHAFQDAGYRTGLYTSPHLSCYRERIRINGEMITEEQVVEELLSLFQLIEKENIPATFFELTTFLAFQHFAHHGVEIAVIETGLGGRLDATNCITPCLSIITSISLEHTEILGSTIEKIAEEKAGIIKHTIPVVLGPRTPIESIRAIADKQQSPCLFAQGPSPLFEIENRNIAKTALQFLAPSFKLSERNINKGLEGGQPCRFERLKGPSPIILDVAHNPDGLIHLFKMLQHHYPNIPVRLLFGLSKNKDLQGCLQIVAQQAGSFHLVEARNGRGASPQVLYNTLLKLGVKKERLNLHPSVHAGVCASKETAEKQQELLVICGTCFIMGEARQALGYAEPFDAFDLNEQIKEKRC